MNATFRLLPHTSSADHNRDDQEVPVLSRMTIHRCSCLGLLQWNARHPDTSSRGLTLWDDAIPPPVEPTAQTSSIRKAGSLLRTGVRSRRRFVTGTTVSVVVVTEKGGERVLVGCAGQPCGQSVRNELGDRREPARFRLRSLCEAKWVVGLRQQAPSDGQNLSIRTLRWNTYSYLTSDYVIQDEMLRRSGRPRNRR